MDPPQVGDKVLIIRNAPDNDSTSGQIYDSYVDPMESMNGPVIPMAERGPKVRQRYPTDPGRIDPSLVIYEEPGLGPLHIHFLIVYQN